MCICIVFFYTECRFSLYCVCVQAFFEWVLCVAFWTQPALYCIFSVLSLVIESFFFLSFRIRFLSKCFFCFAFSKFLLPSLAFCSLGIFVLVLYIHHLFCVKTAWVWFLVSRKWVKRKKRRVENIRYLWFSVCNIFVVCHCLFTVCVVSSWNTSTEALTLRIFQESPFFCYFALSLAFSWRFFRCRFVMYVCATHFSWWIMS